MTKVQIWTNIPDGFELACDEMRPPKEGEMYFSPGWATPVLRCQEVSGPRIILRPTWQWPEWLKAAAIAMDSAGEWWAYESQPEIVDDGEWFIDWDSVDVCLSKGHFDFTPPPCTDWRQSLRLNPNREAKQ